jgi:hypothetical protein
LVIDRILKGEKAVDLPVMQPTKFDFLIKFQGREGARPHHSIPPGLLATADELIE